MSSSTPPPLPKPTGTGAALSLLQLRRQARAKEPSPSLLNVQELERFENLLLFARAVVEGYFSGKHKSPYRGSAAEFADYKEYTPGDELSRLDWRVYGRTRRLYLRQFEEETDMTVYLMVDISGSMRYAGEKRPSKYLLAAKIAAALAYLMMAQSDKAALVLFAQRVMQFLAPGGTRRHLHRLVTELERVRPALTTGIAGAVQECNALFKKRGRIVILSDFLDDTTALFDALAQFVHRKFEILLLQIVDPDELNLPAFNAAKFIDLETAETVQVDPDEIRASYRAHIQQHIDTLAHEADLRRIQHRLVDTQRPYLDAIEAYLGFRGRNERQR
ncbi:protein of unknown function DUF58 [Chthoniobacter flavus Ellin428]|uniref:DUF58 domain-containing protein n=1 Tax=Chthoniobacter flavus Ellin428 TaxID=497964 RepID=B4D6K3_9BACT|nr:DUF58 domain-containing protein [Chthoniobacter flavus]EDY17804.1 protein of unknown function DUF58 [Chthoniobacter flavus Ellin428]TCO88416.1 uncharacterized protein DUF58 [Chthoniobacter flavus]